MSEGDSSMERCKNIERVCQDWPKSGRLRENMDRTLSILKEILKDVNGTVYAYILTTVHGVSGCFVQKGSAPNFQGDLITLSTCKHAMRTYRSPKDWKDVWIAGFTGVNATEDHLNYLFYLMRVKDAFQSHKELWDWLDPSIRKAKNARYNICGDIYEPKSSLRDPFNPSEYYLPIKNHVHEKDNVWHKDINYWNSKTRRRPALLVGDPAFSFLWSQSEIYYNKCKSFRTKKFNMQEFIQSLASK
jgi:hypothetical protein